MEKRKREGKRVRESKEESERYVCQCMHVSVYVCMSVYVCVCVRCAIKRSLKRVVVYVGANTHTYSLIHSSIHSHLVYVAAAGEIHVKFIACPWPILNVP